MQGFAATPPNEPRGRQLDIAGNFAERVGWSDVIRRIATVIMLAAGVCTLLLANLFAALTPLSSGFAARRTTALLIGIAAIVSGVVLNVVTPRARLPGTARRFFITVMAGLALGWLSFGALVFSVQDRLVFSPRGLSPSRLERIAAQYPHAEDIEIVAADGTMLRGWLLPSVQMPPADESNGDFSPKPMPLVLVFAGQGGEASRYFDLAKWLPDMAWAFINYRGYGASDGSPSDAALFDDATIVFDYFTSRPDIDATNVFALGGSMGTGVATYLAAHRPLAAVVLFSPYDSIGAGVAQDLLPWLPTNLLFRNRFDAVAYAPLATAPVLAIIGEDDLVIRPARSHELLRHWGGSYHHITVPGGDHYSIYEDEDVWREVQQFVRDNMNPWNAENLTLQSSLTQRL